MARADLLGATFYRAIVAWHRGDMLVELIDSHDEAAFGAWYEVLRVTDEERWPGQGGWDLRTVKAMADLRNGATDFLCLAATDESGSTVGIGMLQVPQWENRHRVTLDVRVLPSHRRRHIGSAIVEGTVRWAVAAGRRVIYGEAEVPVRAVAGDASAAFARHHGYVAVQKAHRRHLSLPIDEHRIRRLQAEVVAATSRYRTHAFTAPWPEAYLDDCCVLQRRMSTDAPSGDGNYEEEVWNAARIKEMDDLAAAQGLVRSIAVAEDIGSGRLVAFSEIAIPEGRPSEGWQWATLVLREHRGHRLGLAVKMANVDYLGAAYPSVRLIITGNAQENAPMIAVNEMLGFEVVADQTLWQKSVETAS
jgi:GNAT superfamily N-acetyltransferase